MNPIKLRVRKCRRDGHTHWLLTHDGHLLDFAANQPHAAELTDYWTRSFKEYRP